MSEGLPIILSDSVTRQPQWWAQWIVAVAGHGAGEADDGTGFALRSYRLTDGSFGPSRSFGTGETLKYAWTWQICM